MAPRLALDAGDGVTAMAKGEIPLEEWSGSAATDRLRAVIEEHQNITKRQTTMMIWLTWVMAALTLVTAAPIIVQIYRAVRSWVFWQAVSVWFP
jgi:hypothetical protein